MLYEDAIETGDNEDDKHHNVKICGSGKCGARLFHAAQVHYRHHKDADETQRHGPGTVEPCCGANGKHTTGNTHSDCEDVVNEKR